MYASVFGSWNTLLPQGHEIIRIDLGIDGQGHVVGEPIRFATDLGTPLPLRFHPDGDPLLCYVWKRWHFVQNLA